MSEDAPRKASMVKRNQESVQAFFNSETGQHLDVDGMKINSATPIDYVGADGEVHTGLAVVKPSNPSSPGEWWWKIMLSDLLGVLEDISGKQADALRAILDEFDPVTGIVIKSQKDLAVKAGCSLMTVNKVIKIMVKRNLITMPSNGIYVINPRFMSQGGNKRFDTLLIRYEDCDKKGQGRLNVNDQERNYIDVEPEVTQDARD